MARRKRVKNPRNLNRERTASSLKAAVATTTTTATAIPAVGALGAFSVLVRAAKEADCAASLATSVILVISACLVRAARGVGLSSVPPVAAAVVSHTQDRVHIQDQDPIRVHTHQVQVHTHRVQVLTTHTTNQTTAATTWDRTQVLLMTIPMHPLEAAATQAIPCAPNIVGVSIQLAILSQEILTGANW